MSDDECELLQEDLCTLDGKCRFQVPIIQDGIEWVAPGCSATSEDLISEEEYSYDLSPEEERDIERHIYFMVFFMCDPDAAEVAARLLHKFWGLL